MKKNISILIILLGILVIFSPFVSAQIATSTSYKVDSQVVGGLDGYATSSNYLVESAVVYYGSDVGTSSSYSERGGFISTLEYNYPSLTATAGDSQVALAWTAVQGIENVTYEPGYSGGTGGPYTYQSEQSATDYTRTGISNATNQYYIIRAKDGSGNIIGYSSEVAKTSNGASGGGGGISFSPYYPPSVTDENGIVWEIIPVLPRGEVPEDLGSGEGMASIYDTISGGYTGGIAQATPGEIINPPKLTPGTSPDIDIEPIEGDEIIPIEKGGNLLFYVFIIIIFIGIFWWMKKRRNFNV